MKKKLCLIYIFILSLLIIPNIDFAETIYYDSAGEAFNDAFPLSVAMFMEGFVSIHMSIFVLLPISAMITKTTTKQTFLKLFTARVIILLFFDFFVTTAIALVDFLAVFVGAFIVVPIMGATKAVKKSSNEKDVWKDKKDVFTATGTVKTAGSNPSKVECDTCGTTYKVEKPKNVNPVHSGIELGSNKPVKTGIEFSGNKPIKNQPIKLGGDEPIKEDEHNDSPIKFN